MSEFEDKLHAILSDPAELERIGRLAAELMGGGQSGEGSEPPGDPTGPLRRLGSLLGGAGDGDKRALVEALSPFLRPERRARLGRAMRLAGMLRLAAAAFSGET